MNITRAGALWAVGVSVVGWAAVVALIIWASVWVATL